MTVTLVAAVARNGVIGRKGALPWHLPGEQRQFKAITMGHVLIMGRRTYESIGRPLPGRTTVVVTRNPAWEPPGRPDGVVVATSVESALRLAGEIDEQVYVVGGGQIYAESLSGADELLITQVDAEPEGDTHFPPVDWEEWAEVSCEKHEGWTLATYTRRRAPEGYRGHHVDVV